MVKFKSTIYAIFERIRQQWPFALLVVALFFVSLIGVAYSQSWSGGFLRDAFGNLCIQSTAGKCGVVNTSASGGPTPAPVTQTTPGYVRVEDANSTNALGLWQLNNSTNHPPIFQSPYWSSLSLSILYGMDPGNGTYAYPQFVNSAGEASVNSGGNTTTKTTATVCTAINTGNGQLHKVWASGSETATLTIYSDSACTVAIWGGVPPTTPITFDATFSALYYKESAAPAVNDYVTSN